MPKNLTIRYKVWRSDSTSPEGWKFLAGLPGERASHASDVAVWARQLGLVSPTDSIKVLTTRYNDRGVIRNIVTTYEPKVTREAA